MKTAARLALPLLCVLYYPGTSRAAEDSNRWDPYRFLVGDWVGEGSGKPGTGTGQCSFAFDLQGKIMVRKNLAEYPTAQGRPVSKHEDLMVIYWDERSKSMHAVYFDSEDHVINYKTKLSDDKQTLTFVSVPLEGSPRFRLSYSKLPQGALRINFEIAPPGQPDGFKTYVEGVLNRRDRETANQGDKKR